MWQKSLTIISFLAILSVVLSVFYRGSANVLMLIHIMGTISLALVAFTCFMYYGGVEGKGKQNEIVLAGVGSFGQFIGFVMQMMNNQVLSKPVVNNVAALFFCIGVTIILSKHYSDVDQNASEKSS